VKIHAALATIRVMTSSNSQPPLDLNVSSISASLIVIAGAACLCAGAFVPNPDFRTYVLVGVGMLICLAGAFGWFVSLMANVSRVPKQDDDGYDDDEP
jgi:hypothetical protein